MSNQPLHPPFRMAQFSRTIKVELFEGMPDEATLARYADASTLEMAVNTFGHSLITIIGYYSFGIGFFLDRRQSGTAVYTIEFAESKDKFVRIADSIEAFYETLLRVYSIWQSDAVNNHLPQTDSTKNKMQEVFRYLEKLSPGSSPVFWQLYFFGDLHIGLEP